MKFSLRSLFVLTAAVAVLAWVGATVPIFGLVLVLVTLGLLANLCIAFLYVGCFIAGEYLVRKSWQGAVRLKRRFSGSQSP